MPRTATGEASSPREWRSSKQGPLPLPCLFLKRFLIFMALPLQEALLAAPAYADPQLLSSPEPCQEVGTTGLSLLTDSSLTLASSIGRQGGLRVPSLLSSPVSLTAWATDVRPVGEQRLGWAGLRSSSLGVQASDDTQVFTHPQGFQQCREEDPRGGGGHQAASPASRGLDHGRGGEAEGSCGWRPSPTEAYRAGV